MGFGGEEDPGNRLDGVERRDDTRGGPQDALWTFNNKRIEGCSDTEHDVVPACSAEACCDRSSYGSNPDDSDDTQWDISMTDTEFLLDSSRHD
jgi:hypothetical protein